MPYENPLYTYETVILDLSIARTGVEFSYAGNFIKAIDASDINANIDIAFNSSGNDTVNIKKGRGIRANIIKMYLTNAVQVGKTITLLIATDDSLQIRDDGVVGDIDTIQEIVEPVAINHLPDKIISDQGLSVIFGNGVTATNVINANSIVYTVPANKVFYLSRLSMTPIYGADGRSLRYWAIFTGGSATYYIGDASFWAVGTQAMFSAHPIYFNPWLKLVAAQSVRLFNYSTCTGSVSGFAAGYLKNA